tara:strand:- start:2407 stop:2931 length:525 start_codon:yes stop_codon:yes gene_type:complete
MIIDKEINSQIEQDYIFITGHIDVDQKYFVQKIEEGIKAGSNLNNQTAIQGFMTHWDYFNNDPQLQKLLLPMMDKLDKIKNVPKYKFFNSWGYAESFGHRTTIHCHGDSLFAGSLYLNDHDQELIFPKINEKVKPERGRFVLFSGFLKHYTNRNITGKTKYGLSFNFVHRNYYL